VPDGTFAKYRGVSTKPRDIGRAVQITQSALRFFYVHPDAVFIIDGQSYFDERYRDFVLELMAPGGLAEGVELEELQDITRVPVTVLRDWVERKPEGSPFRQAFTLP